MSDAAVRYAKVAGRFDEVVKAVPADRWDSPAPCEGWVARDVVRHLCDWMPGMFFGEQDPTGPSVDDDPVAAWSSLHGRLTALTNEPDFATMELGGRNLEQSLNSFGTGDIFIHIWDLAAATGLPADLDSDEVHGMYEGMAAMDDAMRGEHFGPKVDVPEDSDEQTKLLAFTGRDPLAWT